MTPHRRVSDNFHWPLFLGTAAILAIGLVNLFSAAYATRPTYFFSQIGWTAIAVVIAAVAYAIDYRVYERLAYFLFGVCLVLLVAVLFSRPIGGSQRWLNLGIFNLQPSEPMKIFLVMALAKYFHNTPTPKEGHDLWSLRKVWLIILTPMALVLKEPDLGTSLLLAIIAFSLLLFTRIKRRTLIAMVLAALILIPVGWHYVLKDYQKTRIMTLFDPGSDPRGSGYHRRQSVIAIGSGMVNGKGFRNGTQTQLRFLPEQHTDFIFSVWAEEQGYVGSLAVLSLYLTIILSGLHVASKAREKFGALLAVGATAVLFWQIFINIGMVIGLLPVVGVTLPFMSYGGTSMIICMVCVALLLNVYGRRRLF